MDKKHKITILVLSIIAVLLFIVGLARCSVQEKESEPQPSPALETQNTAPDDNLLPQDPGEWSLHLGDEKPEADEPAQTDPPTGGAPAPVKPAPAPKPTSPANPTQPTQPTQPPVVPVTPPPKPTEPPAKPPEPKPSENNPGKPDDGNSDSGGSGGSTSYPAAMVEIILPEYSHTDAAFNVKTTLRNVKSMEWSVAEEDKDTPQAEFLMGALDKDGGKITITRPGSYILTATAKNYGNRSYTFSKAIVIHPTLNIQVASDQTAHTDTAFTVTTALSDTVKQQLNWHIFKDVQELKWQDAVTGTLSNSGGSIRLKEKGHYTIKAVAFDETSREFSGKASITVYPVIEITAQSPETAHTDTQIPISVNTKELGELSLIWSATKDGEEISLAENIAGALDNSGGTIRCLHKGAYTFTASATDQTGRSFTAKTDLKVYPVAGFSFSLPATAHTDQTIALSVQSAELQDMTAVWTVIKDGDPVPAASVINGNLSNAGGAIRFTQKGSYLLNATLTDPTGRDYSHTSSTVVYPVAEAGFYLPGMTHPDTAVKVETSFKEAQNLAAVWSLTKDGKAIALADGFEGALANSGGTIRFRDAGSYELTATVTDTTGRSFSHIVPVKVLPIIAVSLELPGQTHTDRPVTAAAELKDAGTLPVTWSIAKNDAPATPEHTLTDSGGSIHFTEKGRYLVTASVTDESGRSFSASKAIQVYPVPDIAFTLPEAVHTDDTVTVDTVLADMEGLTAVWYVDNTYGFQDWDTYIAGNLQNHGGAIRFARAGVYDLQARVTDATGRVFFFNSGKIEVLPVLELSFILPETGYTDTQIDVRTRGNIGVLPVEWRLMKNGQTVPLDQTISGALNAQGGKIRFPSPGEYRLTATMFDALGRVFSASEKISIYPLYSCSFTMPNVIHTGHEFVVALDSGVNLGEKSIAWTAYKDGQQVVLTDYFKGALTNSGGTVHVDVPGSYRLTAIATDELDRSFSHSQTIEVTNTAPTKPTLAAGVTRTYQNGKFLVTLTASSADADGDPIAYEYEGKSPDDYYALGSHTVRVRAKDAFGGISDWTSVSFTVANGAPTTPAVSASVNRSQHKDGKFLVLLTVNSTDPDGDAVTYEYQNKAADNYYPIGTHTVQVRAKDSYGGVSDWASVSFTVANEPPTRPEITRTPGGNSVVPGTPVTIKASSTDPDGDPITYIWDGRGAETSTYPMGKNTVRVKAVDSYGAESPWAAIVFFVMDNNGSGGMMLTGPESVILENGVEGATITKWTFNVPPVSGHNANYDYGEVRGFNQATGQWERLTNVSFNASIGSSFAATDGNVGRVYSNNGVYMSGTLSPGVYSKLQYYYYTPHTCMYNKSNITYTVEYYFD
ncbi:hypothetical protein [Sporomusa sphaeroides]|uniref:hypothetical protein n=1 Tax=Sporomusa sphaeroides TaxID=47679 RepID=UPI002C01465C|nr:hypothetical protein [Sporomusa sphaeroides]HML33397.1 hypothetical protein [Sporomusa sphaeroides]